MDVTERLREAVLPVVPVCVPDVYDGEEEIYCTFSIDHSPEAEGNNYPTQMLHRVQLHLLCPPASRYDPRDLRRRLCRAVAAAGFTYPSVTNASDLDEGHLVFECEDVDGDF